MPSVTRRSAGGAVAQQGPWPIRTARKQPSAAMTDPQGQRQAPTAFECHAPHRRRSESDHIGKSTREAPASTAE
jgi:hypothetical protein